MPKINAPTIPEHKKLTRAALLNAGADAFVTYGFGGTSIGVLADSAGIARTTVYEYFPNKESVLASLIGQRLPPIIDRLLDDLPKTGPSDRLAAILRRAFQFVANYPVEATLLFRVSRELPKVERDEAWSVFAPVRHELVRLCADGVASGEFAAMDPKALGTIVADHLVGGIDEISTRGPASAPSVTAARIGFIRHGLTSD